MRSNEVSALYDSDYAAAYDERFLFGRWLFASDFETKLLSELLKEGSRWLDVGCGTGYFLSRFPGVERAGLDLSPAMLAKARECNPDALFFREADFRDRVAEWEKSFTLLTCMWGAYCYVDSIREVQRVVANMVDWTSLGGAVFIPTLHMPGDYIPFCHESNGGLVIVNGYIWSWDDGPGKMHRHMVLPHPGQFAEWLAPHFNEVRVMRYPTPQRGAVLATGRRAVADPVNPGEIIWDPNSRPDIKSRPLIEAPFRALLAELGRRLRPRRIMRRLGF